MREQHPFRGLQALAAFLFMLLAPGCDYFPGWLIEPDLGNGTEQGSVDFELGISPRDAAAEFLLDAQEDGVVTSDTVAVDAGPLDGGAPESTLADMAPPDAPPIDTAPRETSPFDAPPPIDAPLLDTVPAVDTAMLPDGGGVLFYDGFESGLAKWIGSGTGKPWAVTSTQSAKGSSSAMAQATGAGQDSFITASFVPPGAGVVTLQYRRRLQGMDSPDDFQVEAHYSGTWVTVEQVGAGQADDAAFVLKSFNLPNTASKIRFKCECGAVSERCLLDEVIVTVK